MHTLWINLTLCIISFWFLQGKFCKIPEHRAAGLIDGIFFGLGLCALSPFGLWMGSKISGGGASEISPDYQNIHWWLLLVTSTLLAPYWEELVFRGKIQEILIEKTNTVTAIAFISLMFPLIHFGKAPIMPNLVMLSVVCSILTLRHKSVTPAIICHSVFNAGSLTFFF